MFEKSVNYVWINKEPKNKGQDDVLCNIPLHYIDKAIQNAIKYPNAEFNIWLDYRFLDLTSKFFLESHLYFSAPTNLNVKSLEDVETYRCQSFFHPDANHNIWARVDYARLLVLDHIFEEDENIKEVYYADFDTEDVKIESPAIQKRMSELGMAFGATYKLDIENNYMGFTRDRWLDFLTDLIIDSEVDAIEGKPTWKPLYDNLNRWADEMGVEMRKFGHRMMTSTGYKIPPNPNYLKWGLHS